MTNDSEGAAFCCLQLRDISELTNLLFNSIKDNMKHYIAMQCSDAAMQRNGKQGQVKTNKTQRPGVPALARSYNPMRSLAAINLCSSEPGKTRISQQDQNRD